MTQSSITERMADIYLQKLADASTPEALDDLETRLYKLADRVPTPKWRFTSTYVPAAATRRAPSVMVSAAEAAVPGSLAEMLVDHGEATVCPPEAAASPTLADALTELAEAAGAELQTEAGPQVPLLNPVKGDICVLNGHRLEFDGTLWRGEAQFTAGLPGDHLVMNGVEYVRTFETPTGWRPVADEPPADNGEIEVPVTRKDDAPPLTPAAPADPRTLPGGEQGAIVEWFRQHDGPRTLREVAPHFGPSYQASISKLVSLGWLRRTAQGVYQYVPHVPVAESNGQTAVNRTESSPDLLRRAVAALFFEQPEKQFTTTAVALRCGIDKGMARTALDTLRFRGVLDHGEGEETWKLWKEIARNPIAPPDLDTPCPPHHGRYGAPVGGEIKGICIKCGDLLSRPTEPLLSTASGVVTKSERAYA